MLTSLTSATTQTDNNFEEKNNCETELFPEISWAGISGNYTTTTTNTTSKKCRLQLAMDGRVQNRTRKFLFWWLEQSARQHLRPPILQSQHHPTSITHWGNPRNPKNMTANYVTDCGYKRLNCLISGFRMNLIIGDVQWRVHSIDDRWMWDRKKTAGEWIECYLNVKFECQFSMLSQVNGTVVNCWSGEATRMGTLRTLRTLRICIHPRGWRTWVLTLDVSWQKPWQKPCHYDSVYWNTSYDFETYWNTWSRPY